MFTLTPVELAEAIVDDLDYLGMTCVWIHRSPIGARLEVGNKSTTFAYVNVDFEGNVTFRLTSLFGAKKISIKWKGSQEEMSAHVCAAIVRHTIRNR